MRTIVILVIASLSLAACGNKAPPPDNSSPPASLMDQPNKK